MNFNFEKVNLSKTLNKIILKDGDNPFVVDITGTIVKINDNNLYLKSDQLIVEFNETLKKIITKYVLENSKSIYGIIKTVNTINEFYCSSIKNILVNSKYIEVLKCKNSFDFLNYERVNLKIEIKLWFNKNSFGTYYNVIGINEKIEKKCFFLNESSSEEEI